jgi:hypothetical protein
MGVFSRQNQRAASGAGRHNVNCNHRWKLAAALARLLPEQRTDMAGALTPGLRIHHAFLGLVAPALTRGRGHTGRQVAAVLLPVCLEQLSNNQLDLWAAGRRVVARVGASMLQPRYQLLDLRPGADKATEASVVSKRKVNVSSR